MSAISLIGITGPARHGKDTVGQMLLSHMPHSTRFAFADALKGFLLEAFDFGEHYKDNKEGEVLFLTSRGNIETAMLNTLHKGIMMYGVDVKEATGNFVDILRKHHGNFHELHDGRILFTSSWRKMFQLTGTEWGRQTIDEMFWIDPWLPDEECVITDVRGHGDSKEFRNVEAEAIIKRGGIVIRVVDPRKEGTPIREHASEAGIDESLITETIKNNGTLEELEGKVRNFMYAYLLDEE